MQKTYRVREKLHDNLVDHLLLSRGIAPESFEQFLRPDFERDSHDPFLLPDMGAAVERILAARKSDEYVCVWSDYDCDGIPGGVLLTEFLRDIGVRVRHYIPHRHHEGFGLNNSGLDQVAGEGVTLVITVDLGTSNAAEVAHARELGMDVIITDHHLAPEILPLAVAIVNPKRTDSAYPYDGLCGAGVAWKLVQALLIVLRKDPQFSYAPGKEKWLLDLAGIATLSDMVPLRGENRMLAHFGLRVARRNRRPGLAALLSMLRIKPETLTEDDIGFMVAPRINAASRMDSPEIASRLLASRDSGEASALAKQLNAINDERKGVVAAMVKEANKRLKEQGSESSVIVVGNPNWRPGVAGIVANSLMEAHGKPAFVWGRDGGGVVRGSCRSPASINVVELMTAAAEIFVHFGGHHSSGGFALEQDRVHELSARLARAYTELALAASGVRETVIDRELDMGEVSRAERDLRQLAPFGMENSKPLFVVPRVSVAAARRFGKAGDHLELRFERDDAELFGVSFFSSPESFTKPVTPGAQADIVGHVELDWRGNPRLRVVDVI